MASREERSMSFGAIAADYDRFRPGPPAIDVPMRTWCWRADRAHR